MAVLGIRIACYAEGVTLLTLSFNASLTGTAGFATSGVFRIVRRKTGEADKILPTEMNFQIAQVAVQPFSWAFIDENVPSSGDWDYIAQFKQVGTAEGNFDELQLTAVHYKR